MILIKILPINMSFKLPYKMILSILILSKKKRYYILQYYFDKIEFY
jgi:hypothetical protein